MSDGIAPAVAAELGSAIAAAWGADAVVGPWDGDAGGGDGEPTVGCVIDTEPGRLWLGGDLAPGLPEAVAAVFGGAPLPDLPAPPADGTETRYRWSRAAAHGLLALLAPAEVWRSAIDGLPGLGRAGSGTAATSVPGGPASGAAGDRSGAAGHAVLDADGLLPPLPDAGPTDELHAIDLLLDVPLDVTVELGRTRCEIRDVLALNPGSIVQLDHVAGEPVDVLANGRLIARGEVVVIDETFGVRVTDIVSLAERLSRLA